MFIDLGTFVILLFFSQTLTPPNFTMLMLVDFDVFLLFSHSAQLGAPGISWGTGEEIFSRNAQLRALYLEGRMHDVAPTKPCSLLELRYN